MKHVRERAIITGTLTPEEKAHIGQCPSCDKAFQQYRSIEAGISKIPEVEMPLGFRQKLIERISQPVYSLKQLFASFGLLITSPIVLHRYREIFAGFSYGEEILVFSYMIVSLMLAFMTLPLVWKMHDQYHGKIHSIAMRFDEWLSLRAK